MYRRDIRRIFPEILAVPVFAALLFGSCSTLPSRIEEPAHGPENISGRYSGILPCADCPGILNILELSQSGNFTLRESYLDRNSSAFTGRGVWKRIEATQLNLTFEENSRTMRLAITPSGLKLLNQDGSEISTEFPDLYELGKNSPSLQNTRWEIQKLGSRAPGENPQEEKEGGYFISFAPEGYRFAAKAGCNTLIGEYSFTAGGELTFTAPASTLMACPDMSMEELLADILTRTRGWRMQSEQMMFLDQEGSEIAVFTVIQSGEKTTD
ncbi:copper resistance protein NlpE N-terminal domain-containing protein [Salinispira pacifica]|uniref:Lipoprotein n=1 Tax=Salinispira pacifica TaxID=1307761 RepID=V5WLH4_9SPIO|nr:copper resistance protein NlpE N-terminal domain-containing protein [Salinispira pacifica]AHC16762.1 Lipoprotein [Salinispira pacifica]